VKKPSKWIVGLVSTKPTKPGPHLFIRVQAVPATRMMCPVVFVERSARVAVRRYIKGNLSEALACFDDGANEPADAAKPRAYGRSLRRRYMIPGTTEGFRVDFY